jgi:hypothetical protein
MDAADSEPNPSADLPPDELTKLQIKVAQRADQISQKTRTARERDRAHWLEAEQEILPPP